MSASVALVKSFIEWNGGPMSADELVGRLHGADDNTVLQMIAPLSSHQRANLAVFCYRKAHLHRVGLVIASSCDQLPLMQALGTALGRTLFAQSREFRREVDRAPAGQRSKITLAGRATREAMPAEMSAI